MKKVLAAVCALATCVAFSTTVAFAATPTLKVTGSASVQTGKSITLKATVSKAGKAKVGTISWTASGSSAKLSAKSGKSVSLSGVSAGSTKVTAKVKVGTKTLKATKSVTVICNHSYTVDTASSTLPTCTTAGKTVYRCTLCGELAPQTDVVAPLGHTAGAAQETAATCTTAGKSVTKCTVCGEVLSSKDIPALGHTSGTPQETAATCTTAGKSVTKCTVCGEVVSTKEIPATGHTWADGVCTVCKTACPNTANHSTTACSTCGYVKAGFTKDSYTVEFGTKNTYINYTGTDNKEHDATIECRTAKYTFTSLPSSFEELKQLDLTNEFAPVAAHILALRLYTNQGILSTTNPYYDIIDYLNGKAKDVSNVTKQRCNEQMNKGGTNLTNAYFAGATPANGYTPSQPYTLYLVESPYYLPAATTGYSAAPERYPILIYSGINDKGEYFTSYDDSPRYIDVYKSSDGNYYSWDDQFLHLTAGIKDATPVW